MLSSQIPKMSYPSTAAATTTITATTLIPLVVFLSILSAVASDPDTFHGALTESRHPLPGPVILLRRTLAENSTSKPSPPNHSAASRPASSPSANRNKSRTSKRKIRKWTVGFFLGSIAGVFTGLLISFLFRFVLNFVRGRYRNLNGSEFFSHVVKNKTDLAFLAKDDGLANLTVIGRGACGEVYRKEITTTSGEIKVIAIKQIRMPAAAGPTEPLSVHDSRMLDKWTRQIRSEIKTVGRIRHRNLLPLIAHVYRPDCHYLVYEYMKNGSLHDAIRDAAAGSRELNWHARLRVANGMAAGLEHLHLHHKPQVVHRDLKPDNVLLDDNMEARISDFGLAKEVPDGNTHMTTLNVAGTIGYIAPEYYQTLKYTAKCDVYSFGVMLGVLVMGRFPSDVFFLETEELGLVKWMRKQVVAGNVAACFDEKIAGRGEDDQLELALRVACFCTADNAMERPNSKEVRHMLGQIGRG